LAGTCDASSSTMRTACREGAEVGAQSHPWPGRLGGDRQHPAVRSATTAAKAAIFAGHTCPSARSFEPKLQPGDDRRATPPNHPGWNPPITCG
jgi:hypothetical protein